MSSTRWTSGPCSAGDPKRSQAANASGSLWDGLCSAGRVCCFSTSRFRPWTGRRKAEILPYLLALHPRFGIPTLYVSHAVDEVALLADRILVLADGRVQAFGGTVEVMEQLDLAPLTERFQAAAVLEAQVSAHDDEYRLSWLDLDGQRLSVPRIEHLGVGESARLLVRARDVSLATERPSPTSIRNVLSGVLVALHQDDATPFAEATVDLGSHRLRARITRASAAELGLCVGLPVFALLKSVSLDTRAGRS